MNINFGKILSMLNNKLDRDMNNLPKNFGIITDYDYSEHDWYNVIGENILIQGGYRELDANNISKTITLAKPLKDNTYKVIIPSCSNILIYDKTISSFKIRLIDIDDLNKTNVSWYLWGYLG